MTPGDGFHRYVAEDGVHVADCSGAVDLAKGLARLDALEAELRARPARDGVRRLLVDFRGVAWADDATHMQLSRATRDRLAIWAREAPIRVAFVADRAMSSTTEVEAWFIGAGEAMAWLVNRHPTPTPTSERR
jgi:hypothetical protein